MYKEAIDEIRNANSVYIATHTNPDGDAIGSSIALCLAIRKLNKNAKVILKSYADIFKTMPYIEESVDHIEESNIDLLICLDSSDIQRVCIDEEDIKKAKRSLCIDHHNANRIYTNVTVRDEKAPATAELIYNLICEMNIEIDKDIASNLYAGILTDTGSFKYSNTRPETFEIASKLVKTGIAFDKIARDLLDTYKDGKLKLLGKYINNIEELENGKIIYSLVSYEQIKQLNLSDEDAEGMTNYGLMVDHVEVSIYIREKEDGTFKVSMRSKGKVNVATIAIHFNGGGHDRAAGCAFAKEEKDEKIVELIEKVKEQLYQ